MLYVLHFPTAYLHMLPCPDLVEGVRRVGGRELVELRLVEPPGRAPVTLDPPTAWRATRRSILGDRPWPLTVR